MSSGEIDPVVLEILEKEYLRFRRINEELLKACKVGLRSLRTMADSGQWQDKIAARLAVTVIESAIARAESK